MTHQILKVKICGQDLVLYRNGDGDIVCLSDNFVHLMIDEELKPVEALKKIISNPNQVKKYNSMIVENFIKVFADPSKIVKKNAMPSNSKVVSKKAS